MALIDEIHAFAREYVNNKSTRTRSRNAKIRQAYQERTGKRIKITCSTCYLEALFELINNTVMATRNYELKRGYLAQFDAAFEGVKSFTNDTMTDELAEEYLRRYPARAMYFSRLPQNVTIIPVAVKIIPPVVVEPNVTEDLIASVTEPKVIKPKTPRKPKK